MRPSHVPRLVMVRFLLLVLFLVMLPVFALRPLLMWTAVTLILRFGVPLLLIPPVHFLSMTGLILVTVGLVLPLMTLLSFAPLLGVVLALLPWVVLAILSAWSMLLLSPVVLLSVLVGVTSLNRQLLLWPVVLLSVLVGVT